MTKRLFSLVVGLLMVGTATVSAQCTPDPQYIVPGIYPDSATNLPCAIAGQLYSEVITVIVPFDTLAEFPPGSGTMITVNIDSIKVQDTPGGSTSAVSGMPPNFVYACSPTSTCSFAGSSTGCLLLTGNPTLTDTGLYTLVVELVAYVSDPQSGLSLPAADLNSVDYYSIIVVDDISKCPVAGVGELVKAKIGILANVPNPFEGETSIQFTLPAAGGVHFQVHDLLGSLVYTDQFFGDAGVNKFIFSSKGMEAGVYLYTLDDGTSIATGRMVVSE